MSKSPSIIHVHRILGLRSNANPKADALDHDTNQLVSPDLSWLMYLSCTECRSRVFPRNVSAENRIYACQKCSHVIPYPIPRYRLTLEAYQYDKLTWKSIRIVCFDAAVESVTGMSARNIVNSFPLDLLQSFLCLVFQGNYFYTLLKKDHRISAKISSSLGNSWIAESMRPLASTTLACKGPVPVSTEILSLMSEDIPVEFSCNCETQIKTANDVQKMIWDSQEVSNDTFSDAPLLSQELDARDIGTLGQFLSQINPTRYRIRTQVCQEEVENGYHFNSNPSHDNDDFSSGTQKLLDELFQDLDINKESLI